MTAQAAPSRSAAEPAQAGRAASQDGDGRPLIVAGATAAAVVAGAGLAVVVLLVLAGWIAAPHAGLGLPGVLRTATMLWLVGHHVGVTLPAAGHIGMLPLGLVLLPGALLWRAGRWVVHKTGVTRLRHVGYAALALAVPYGLLTGALALASRSALAVASVPEALACGCGLALAAGGLGGARALAPWSRLAGLLPERARSVLMGVTGALAVLVAVGAVLAGASLLRNLGEYAALERGLGPGTVGVALLLLLQLGYVPNAVIWAIAFALGPGFAFGAGTAVSPTGAALAQLPAFPMLAALPPGVHSTVPGWLSAVVLATPYLAGCVAGLLVARVAPTPSLEAPPLWGLACGAITGGLLGLLAAFAGGPLGDGRLAAVGPSGWQVAAVAALETGVAAALTAGLANWLLLARRPAAGIQYAGPGQVEAGLPVPEQARPAEPERGGFVPLTADAADASDGHRIFLDPWAGDPPSRSARADPAALPDHGRGR